MFKSVQNDNFFHASCHATFVYESFHLSFFKFMQYVHDIESKYTIMMM